MQPALLEELSVTLVAVRCEYRMYVYCASPFPACTLGARLLHPPPSAVVAIAQDTAGLSPGTVFWSQRVR